MLILSNNPKVAAELVKGPRCTLRYEALSLQALLQTARDLVHLGHVLLSHPLSGSVKPNETCYKSILLSSRPKDSLCVDSLLMVESAIGALAKFPKRDPAFYAKHQADLQLVDYSLLLSALSSACHMPTIDQRRCHI